MRVLSLTLQRYGAFSDRSVEFGPTGLTLVVGVNEAGKSTALEALSDLLWGIPHQSSQAFRYGRPALAVQARLAVPGADPVQVVRRSTGLSRIDTGEDLTCSWQAARDSRSRWRESFGLSHAELREGGSQLCRGNGDLAELVFAARSGQAVRELLAELDQTVASLYKEHRGNKSVAVRKAHTEYDQAKKRAAEAMANSQQVRAVREDKEHAARAVQRAEQRARIARAAVTDTAARLRAAPHARRLEEARRRADTLRCGGAVLDRSGRAALEGAQGAREAADQALRALSEDLEQLGAQRSSLVVEDALLADAADIRRLHAESEARLEDGRRAVELSREASALGQNAAALLAELVGDTDPRGVLELLAALHVPADRVVQLDELGDELRRAEQLVEDRREAVLTAARRVADADADRADVEADIVTAVREAYEAVRAAGSAVSAQRAAVEEHAAAMVRRDDALRLAGLPTGAPVPASMPSSATMTEVGDLLTTAEAAEKEARQRVERDTSSLEGARHDLAASQDPDVPHPNELTVARRVRDASVAELVTAWLQRRPPTEATDLPTRVERATSRVDVLADRLMKHADTAARRAELSRILSQRESAHAEMVRDLDATTRAAEEADRAWRSLWPDLGDACPRVPNAGEIRRQVEAARAAQTQMSAAQSRIAGLQHQVDSQVGALSAVLAWAGRPRPGFDLDALLETARLLLQEADDAREGRAASEQLVRLEGEARRDYDDAVSSCQAHGHAVAEPAGRVGCPRGPGRVRLESSPGPRARGPRAPAAGRRTPGRHHGRQGPARRLRRGGRVPHETSWSSARR